MPAILETEIKVKSPHGYTVTYTIHEFIKSCQDEKEYIEQCKMALIDSLGVLGINKRNFPDW